MNSSSGSVVPVAVRRSCATAILSAAVLVFGGVDRAHAVQVPLVAQPTITTAADNPQFVSTGDVDGDGDIDALVASRDDDSVAWYENVAGDGSTWVEHLVSTAVDIARCVVGADIDGDGDLDLVSVGSADDTVRWHLNADGIGTTWSTIVIGPSDGGHTVFAADLDGDGDLDVLSAADNGNRIAWHENDGTPLGANWTTTTIDAAALGALGVSAADIDGDGDIDPLSASEDNDTVAWYANDGAAPPTFTRNVIATSTLGARFVEGADIDGDGDTDVVVASRDDNTISWHENTVGDGSAWTEHILSAGEALASQVAAVDLDGDGDLDIVGSAATGNSIRWWENLDGVGDAFVQRTIDFTLTNALSFATADFDGDGDFDVVGTSGADRVVWYRNDTIHRSAAFAPAATIATSADLPEAIVTGDIDGDGDLDAVSASVADNEIAWYRNDGGDPIAWLPATISNTAGNAFAVQLVDMDDDGDLDVLAALLGVNRVSWYRNVDGVGGSWTEQVVSNAVGGARSVAAADFDRDGDIDVVSAARDGNAIIVHVNTDGLGTAWSSSTVVVVAAALSVVTGDIDGDGDVDIAAAGIGVTGTATDDRMYWLENSDGTWVARTITTSVFDPSGIVLADIDGDGDLDVASASRSDDRIAWHENDGTPTVGLWTMHTITTAADVAFGIHAADLDRDGDIDLISASNNDDRIRWYQNDGMGTSWGIQTIDAAADGAAWVWAADLDNDGDMDVLSASNNDDRLAWYENRGGQFTFATTATAPATILESFGDDVLAIDLLHLGRAYSNGLDHDVEWATLALMIDDGTGAPGSTPLTTAQANERIERLTVWADDGDGEFDSALDEQVAVVDTLALTGGVQTIAFTDFDPLVAVSPGAVRAYFLELDTTANAGDTSPPQVRITHLTQDGSTAQDRAFDLPLAIEYVADSGTGPIALGNAADLAITVDDGVATVTAGGPVDYTITVSNIGAGGVDDAIVTDDFPSSLACAWTCSGTGGGSCAANGSGDIAQVADLPAGATVVYVASCTLDPAATGSLGNTTTVAAPAGTIELAPGDNSDSDVDAIARSANLSIAIDDGVDSAVPGGELTYTIAVANAGPSSDGGATVAADFADSLTCGWTCSGDSGGSCAASGSGDIAATVGLPAGARVTFVATCAVAQSASGTIASTATVGTAAGVTDPVGTNDSDSDSDSVVPTADIAVTIDDGTSTAIPGTTVTYTIGVANLGPSNAADTLVRDDFPSSLSCTWTCSGTGGATCGGSGNGDIFDNANLLDGSSLVYTAVCTVSPGAVGALANSASAQSSATIVDPSASNDSATDIDALAPTADLAITKTDGVTVVASGEQVTYTIVANNPGPSDAPDSRVRDEFGPRLDACTWTCAGAFGGACAANGSGAIDELVGLPAGGAVTFAATCTVSGPDTGTVENTASVAVAPGVTESDDGDNTATDIDGLPRLFDDGFE